MVRDCKGTAPSLPNRTSKQKPISKTLRVAAAQLEAKEDLLLEEEGKEQP